MKLTIVSYPLKKYLLEVDEQIEKVLGQECSDSGAGFGMRDIEFDDLKIPIKDIKAKLLKELGIKVFVTRL